MDGERGKNDDGAIADRAVRKEVNQEKDEQDEANEINHKVESKDEVMHIDRLRSYKLGLLARRFFR